MKNDPFWMKAKFGSKCICGKTIKKNEKIFFYPKGRTALGSKCGCADKAALEFQALVMDEEFYCR